MTSLDEFAAVLGRSRIYDLGVSLEAGIPHGPAHSPYLYSLIKKHGQIVYRGGVSTATDLFSMGTHVGTHIDALGHVSKDGCLHGQIEAKAVQSFPGGMARCGAHELPLIVGRGVLLDMPRLLGCDVLPADCSIGVEELERAYREQGIAPLPGDIVLVRTGWMRYWPDHERFHSNLCPGVVLEGAHWLGEKGARCVGSDTYAFEKVPSSGLPVHVAMLVERGIPIMEMLDLEALARDGVHAFLFVALPLKIVGGTGSPIRPVAVVPEQGKGGRAS
ncbi:MAG: cyclase family protein [Bradyrhizobiaceae bacterium]|nr:cyclase family protein [Bradyrhizobiaceae bacterium]